MSKASIRKRVPKKAKKAGRVKDQKILEIKPHEQHQDLCSTCAATPECIYPTAGYPVHHCEEFESQAGKSPQPVKLSQVPQETQTLQGLCVNCDNQKTCMHSCTEGGVWHCEEYC